MIYTDAFKHYGATLNNNQWSVSAFSNGELVISVWDDELKFNKETKQTIYNAPLSSWDNNPLGRDEFRKHLKLAFHEKANVRLIKAMRPDGYTSGTNETKESDHSQAKGFDVVDHLIGRVVSFDNEDMPVIVFGKM